MISFASESVGRKTIREDLEFDWKKVIKHKIPSGMRPLFASLEIIAGVNDMLMNYDRIN